MEDVVTANSLARDLDEVISLGGDLWEGLRGARVFITGGTGFFGRWLLESFLWANARLRLGASAVVLTRRPRAVAANVPHLASHAAITLHEGDVRSFAFPEGAFSHVIHAATESSAQPTREDRLALFDGIVTGTRRALELGVHSGATRFLLTSSGAVYGRQPVDLVRVPEDFGGAPDPLGASAPYAEGKRAAETLCALYSSATLQPAIARGFAFVGPFLPLDGHFAVGNFIRDAMSGGPIRVTGDGTPWRSYLYAADLARWLWTILLRGTPERPYNVGSGDAITIRDLAHTVAQVMTPPVAVAIGQSARAGAPAERYVPDVTRAEQELGLRASVLLADAIRRTVEWHKGFVR